MDGYARLGCDAMGWDGMGCEMEDLEGCVEGKQVGEGKWAGLCTRIEPKMSWDGMRCDAMRWLIHHARACVLMCVRVHARACVRAQ